jgi:hypothetical protein
MKFICEFAHPDKIARTTMEIPVELTADDMAELDRLRERQKQRDKQKLPRNTDLDVVVLAMALRHAYKVAPADYVHLRDGVHPVPKLH